MNLTGGKIHGGVWILWRLSSCMKSYVYVVCRKLRVENVWEWKSCAVYVYIAESNVILYRNGSRNEEIATTTTRILYFVMFMIISLMKNLTYDFVSAHNLMKRTNTRWNNRRWNKMNILFRWLKILYLYTVIWVHKIPKWIEAIVISQAVVLCSCTIIRHVWCEKIVSTII